MVGMHNDRVSKDKPCLLYFPNRAWELALENSRIGAKAPRVLEQVAPVECISDHCVHFRVFPIRDNEKEDGLLNRLPQT